MLTQKYARQDPMNKAEQVAVKMRIDQWRLSLFDISKFMKALSEPIARMAKAYTDVSYADFAGAKIVCGR